jgi:hypothetical protein
LSVIVIAVTALLLGVITAQWSLGPRSAPSARAVTRPAEGAIDTGMAGQQRPLPAAQPASTPSPAPGNGRDAGVVGDAGLKADAASSAASLAVPPQSAQREPSNFARRLTRGRVAYVRCDGLESHAGHFPCPRDRALELSVWSALRELERCEQTRGQDGAAEVRLDFGSAEVTTVQFRPANTGNLDIKRVSGCVREALSAVRTKLRPERMVIAFGFSLR